MPSKLVSVSRINENHCKMKTLSHNIFCQKEHLKSVLSPLLFEEVFLDKSTYETRECRGRLKRKVENMLRKCNGRSMNTSEDSWVINLSSKRLTPAQHSIRLNFAPTPRQLRIPRIVAAVEDGLSGIKDEVAMNVRQTIMGLLRRAKLPPRNITL